MLTPEDLKYAETHEWVALDGEIITVGISDHAQSLLGDIVYTELPNLGKVVSAKEAIAVVESVKAASDIYAPLAGEVVAVNDELESDPTLINASPYDSGWLFKIKLSTSIDDQSEASLMNFDTYKNDYAV